MGDFRVRKISDAHDRRKMYQYALKDIAVFERMLKEGFFETGPPMIGAEQELCIVNDEYRPSPKALSILDTVNDEHYTNELALFNLEINLDPLPLAGKSFSAMEDSLISLLQKGYQEAAKYDQQILMAGILPTLKYRHLQFDYMTPIQRYRTLSQSLSDLRGANFEIYLQGVDELIMSLQSVLFEACNTSFQLHLQINPDEFVDQHNWSQMISGPVLSACANSPLLFGKELWAETRVALFKQSLDTRSSQRFLRKKLPRVYFGNDWLRESAAELWKNDIMRFPLLVSSDDLQDAEATLDQGGVPNLRAIRLHNGTTYTWNRLCYGPTSPKPHLRIECRYLPSGPSAIDEIANFAFWIGLMRSEPKQGQQFWKNVDFKTAKGNFVRAARTGLHTVFDWFGEQISARDLILDQLLPMAEKGLLDSGVDADDVKYYLSIIENRIKKQQTGADWTVNNFRNLSKHYGEHIAQRELVRQSLYYQKENIPVGDWEDIDVNTYPVSDQIPKIEDLMSTDILSVNENDSLELVRSVLENHAIHHLPVENVRGDLIGLITDGMIERLSAKGAHFCCFAKDVMIKNPYTIAAHESIDAARAKMEEHMLSGLPVVYERKLVGILTKEDLKKFNQVLLSV